MLTLLVEIKTWNRKKKFKRHKKAWAKETYFDESVFIKMKNFHRIKDIRIKVKRHSRQWWVLGKHTTKTWLGLEYIKTIGEKWVKDANQNVSEEPREVQKHVKLILSLHRVRETQIKRHLDFMSHPLDGQAFYVTKWQFRSGQVRGTIEVLNHCWWDDQVAQVPLKENW